MTLSVLPETGINLLISNGISSVHLIIGFNVKFLSDFIQSLLYLKLTYRLYMYMLKFFKIFWQFFIKAAPKVIPKIGLIKVLKIDFLEWQPCFWIFQRLSIENRRRFVKTLAIYWCSDISNRQVDIFKIFAELSPSTIFFLDSIDVVRGDSLYNYSCC